MIALRVALALGLAAATLLAGAAAGGAFAEDAGGPAAGVPPSAAGQIRVGDALEVSGQPMRLSLSYTADVPCRVVRFYADAFLARGLLPVLSLPDSPAHVSAFDPRDGLQRFVTAVAQPDGQTLVLTGSVDARNPPQLLRGAASASLPVPTEHRAFLGFRSRDGEARAESARYLTALSAGEIAGFYREKLGRDGYLENPGKGEGLLLFQKPGANLSIALQRLSADAGSVVFVTRIEGDPR